MPGPPDHDVPASVGPEPPHRQSSKSARSSPSRKASTRRPIDRLYSAQHLDDHSLYHGGYHDDHDEGESDCEDEDVESIKSLEGKGLNEVRDGVADEKDLEAPPISRKSTTKSRKDPNLVCVHGNTHFNSGSKFHRSPGMVRTIHRTLRIGNCAPSGLPRSSSRPSPSSRQSLHLW